MTANLENSAVATGLGKGQRSVFFREMSV